MQDYGKNIYPRVYLHFKIREPLLIIQVIIIVINSLLASISPAIHHFFFLSDHLKYDKYSGLKDLFIFTV